MSEHILNQRIHFPLLEKKTYLMSASTGLVADYVYDAYKRYQSDRFLLGGDSKWGEENMGTQDMLLWAREQLGRMMNADKRNIAFGDNSSRMLNIFCSAVSLKEDENIVIPTDSFISGHMAWKEKRNKEGFEIRVVPSVGGRVRFEDIVSSCDEKTKVLHICHVENNTGFRHDMKKIGQFCSENNILLIVDAMQSMGVINVDVKKMHIDFLIGGDYKWMTGFCGTGYAYISDRCLSLFTPQGAGWFGAAERFGSHEGDVPLSENADKFEYGYPNAPGIYSLGLAAEKFNMLGGENVEKYVLSLAGYLREKVSESKHMKLMYDFPEEECSEVVKIMTDYSSPSFEEYLEENDIAVNCYYDGKFWSMRVSVHYVNNTYDIDRFISVADNFR